ncbi:MAG: ABC transporter permease [Cytophagales bacterium]|nr:ABC transporter permease [Cytophagales bacterium]
MLKSFLLISIRHILKKGWISGLNIFCLSLGGAICLFVYCFLVFETGYDSAFDQDQQTTYRLERHAVAEGGQITRDALVPFSWAPTLQENSHFQVVPARLIPYSEECNAFFESIGPQDDRKTHFLKNAYYIEPSVLDLFPFQWINLSEITFDAPSIFLSKTAATTIFGGENYEQTEALILQSIQNTGLPSPDYKIVGIYEDLPLNSNLLPGILIYQPEMFRFSGSSTLAYTYVKTPEKLSFEQQSQTHEILQEGETMYLRPVDSIHFATEISNNPHPIGNKVLLIFLAVLGLIIMLLSVTNYTISAIFGTIDRMREVGVRKVLGMKPVHLMINFLIESFLVHLISGVFALAMFQYMLVNGIPFMPDQKTIGVGSPLDFHAIGSVSLEQTLLFTLILFVTSTLLSSIYPALYFNQIRPVNLLKGRLQILNSSMLKGANSVVKTLIIFQLTSSVFFLSGLMIANDELRAVNQRNARSYDLQVRGIFPGLAGANHTFKQMASSSINDLRNRELIKDLSYGNLYRDQVQTRGSIDLLSPLEESKTISLQVVDHRYWSDTLAFLSGENFHPDFGSDPFHIVLNQKALEELSLGAAEEAIGDTLHSNVGKFKIIGITSSPTEVSIAYVSGFRYKTYLDITLHYDPVLSNQPDVYEFVKMAEVHLSTAFPKINLLKRDFQKEQLIEQGINVMFLLFSVLALAIAAFGLFNLSSFIVEKRGKEIDIRKLLGAQKFNLIGIMSSDLFQLVIVASIIAAPIIYLTIYFGLSQYANHIDLSPLLISIPALIVLSIALIVAIPKCWQQANSNLSQSLGK